MSLYRHYLSVWLCRCLCPFYFSQQSFIIVLRCFESECICAVCVLWIMIYRNSSDVFQEDRSNSVTIGVADGHIGLVVGRGGRTIMEISQVYK